MGKATEIRLWEEKWCGQRTLCDSYPTPYITANTKGAQAAEVWVIQGEWGAWNPNFSRHLNDQEMETIIAFMDVIDRERVAPYLMEKIQWE